MFVFQYCSDISKFLILPGLNESSIVIREDSLIGDTDVMPDIVVMLPLLFVHQGDERFDVQIGAEPEGLSLGLCPCLSPLDTFSLPERTLSCSWERTGCVVTHIPVLEICSCGQVLSIAASSE